MIIEKAAEILKAECESLGVEASIETFKVDGVTATSAPTIKLAYNYDTSKTYEADSTIFGAETDLKAEYESSVGFVLPAVYVEDAVTEDLALFIFSEYLVPNWNI